MGATPFQKEAWTEYGIGVMVLFLRYYARWKAVGFKNWQLDDAFAVMSVFFWTGELTMLEIIGEDGSNVGLTTEEGAKLTPEELAPLVLGSKCLLTGWCLYTTLIWCLKGSMLCFFYRITAGLKQQFFVKVAAVLVACAYVIMLGVLLGHCRPIERNWQVYPNPGDECTKSVANYYSLVVLNVSTDAMIVAIPMPMLWKVKLTVRRKIAIGLLLCSGVFVMVATILRCVLSLQDINGINVSTIWAIRETFVGIFAVNAAAIKPLFSNARWMKSSRNGGTDSGGLSQGPTPQNRAAGAHMHGLKGMKRRGRPYPHPYPSAGSHIMTTFPNRDVMVSGNNKHVKTASSSEEMMVSGAADPALDCGVRAPVDGAEHEQQDVLHRGPASPGKHGRPGDGGGCGGGGIVVTTTTYNTFDEDVEAGEWEQGKGSNGW